MKLLIVTQVVDRTHPILGFFHRWLLEFAEHFERIDVICFTAGEHELPRHVHIHSLGKDAGLGKPRQLIRFYQAFWHAYMGEGVDHVFFHMGAIFNILAAPFFLVRKLKGVRFSWWKTHGHINLMGRAALMFVDRVFTAAPESFPVRSSKRRVIGHAIDTDLFAFVPEPDGRTLLFTGRISRTKRIEQVLAVTKKLCEDGVAVATRIIGGVVDEGYARDLHAYVADHGLATAVTFVPGVVQEALVSEYQHAALFMNPSDTDGLDKVVLEAMACGAIPLTANRSFADMLGPYGLYMKKGDIEGYTTRAKEILAMEQKEREALARKLRNIVEREHAVATLPKRIFGVG